MTNIVVRIGKHETDVIQSVADAQAIDQRIDQRIERFGLQQSQFALLGAPHLLVVAGNLGLDQFEFVPLGFEFCLQFFYGGHVHPRKAR